jgi:hypothetical protein
MLEVAVAFVRITTYRSVLLSLASDFGTSLLHFT